MTIPFCGQSLNTTPKWHRGQLQKSEISRDLDINPVTRCHCFMFQPRLSTTITNCCRHLMWWRHWRWWSRWNAIVWHQTDTSLTTSRWWSVWFLTIAPMSHHRNYTWRHHTSACMGVVFNDVTTWWMTRVFHGWLRTRLTGDQRDFVATSGLWSSPPCWQVKRDRDTRVTSSSADWSFTFLLTS